MSSFSGLSCPSIIKGSFLFHFLSFLHFCNYSYLTKKNNCKIIFNKKWFCCVGCPKDVKPPLQSSYHAISHQFCWLGKPSIGSRFLASTFPERASPCWRDTTIDRNMEKWTHREQNTIYTCNCHNMVLYLLQKNMLVSHWTIKPE